MALPVTQVATLLLTKCAAAGLTLAEIGAVISRPLVGFDEELSQLEKACQAARSAVDLNLAPSDSASDDSESDEMVSLFGRQREASLTHMLANGDEGKTGVVMGWRVCHFSNPAAETTYGMDPALDVGFDICKIGSRIANLSGPIHCSEPQIALLSIASRYNRVSSRYDRENLSLYFPTISNIILSELSRRIAICTIYPVPH